MYFETNSFATPIPLYSGNTSRPKSIMFFPRGLYKLELVKNSSLNSSSSVDNPFKNPASFPVFLSTATRNNSPAFSTLDFIASGEQASFGGKHICSILIACSTSSKFICLNSSSVIFVEFSLLSIFVYLSIIYPHLAYKIPQKSISYPQQMAQIFVCTIYQDFC